MPMVHGTYRNGQVVFPAPPDWPDGTTVRVETEAKPASSVGIAEEHWPTDPESIAAWAAAVEALEPVMTPEEDAAWREDLARRKAEQLAMWDKMNADIDRLFQ